MSTPAEWTIFTSILSASKELLTVQTQSILNTLRSKIESRVYSGYVAEVTDYLSSFMQDSNEQLQQLLYQRQQNAFIKEAVNKVLFNKQPKKKQSHSQLNALQKQVQGKVQTIREDLKYGQLSTVLSPLMLSKGEQLYANLQSFHQRGKLVQSKDTQIFLNKLQRMQLNRRKRYNSYLQSSFEKSKAQLIEQTDIQQNQRNQIYHEQLKEQQQKAKQRKAAKKQEQQKIKGIKKLLKKFDGKPIYMRNEQKFREDVLAPLEEERQKKLQAIKNEHKPIDPLQIQSHVQRYESYKQSLIEAYKQKCNQQQELITQAQIEIGQLFKGKHHQNIEPRFQNPQKDIFVKKKIEYSKSVSQYHKPKIDQVKRKQLKDSIKALQGEKKNCVKRYESDGTVFYQPLTARDHRKIGREYLDQLKRKHMDHVGKGSKVVQNKEEERIKYKNYLEQNRDKWGLRATLSQWRKVFNQKDMRAKDKFEAVMGHVQVLEQQARLKESMLRNMRKEDRSLDLKQELDQYYLQSAIAKIGVLKDVIFR